MSHARFTYGFNMHDFFLMPTIRLEAHCEMRYLTVEWLKWYVGIQWETIGR